MAATKAKVKTPAAKAGAGLGRFPKAQVGLPLNPFVGFELSPLEWLEKAPERLQLLSELGANLTPQQVHRIQDASTWCKLASKAAQSEEPKVAAAAAARAMMAVYLTWRLVDELGLLPKVSRDNSRQSGLRKDRRPEVTRWIKQQLARNDKAKSPDLWASAPSWITDQIESGRFAKRVTEVRKGRK